MNTQQYSPRGFSFLPPVVKNLLILNVIAFFATIVLSRAHIVDLNDLLGLHFFKAESHHFYQYITYMFMHGGWSHLFFNMFALWMFGYTLENYWGSKKFLLYYLITGIGAGLVQELFWLYEYRDVLSSSIELVRMGEETFPKTAFLNQIVTIGASGAVYGILLAFGMMFPNSVIYLYFFIPIKAKWFVIIYGLLELSAGIFSNSDGIAHFAHLGGMIFGFFLIKLWQHNDKKKHEQQHWH